MIVQCPACNSRYRIRDANIPPSGGKIRCPSCAHSFVVYPEASDEDEDRTSITNPNALNQLVSKMASKVPPPADEHTATLDKDEINRIRAFQAMAADMGDGDDGTVEIKNPMEVWKSAQAAIQGLTPEGDDSEADDYDAAPTEIVSGDNLPKLPFPSGKPKIPAPAATIPTPSISPPPRPVAPPAPEPVRAPVYEAAPQADPFARPQSGNYAQPSPPANDPFSRPQSGNYPQPGSPQNDPFARPQSGNFPQPGPPQNDPFARPQSGNFPQPGPPSVPSYTPPPAQPSDPFAIPSPDRFQEDGYSTQQLSNPFTGVPATSSNASADILAAIEEVSQATMDPPPPTAAKPDAEHQGPWKLKTDFGLTYEFPDVKSLRNWLSSRDEIDGFKLSADGVNFFMVREFPQFERRAGMSQIGLPQPQNLGNLPTSDPSSPGIPNFGQPSFTPPPSSASQSGTFGGPVVAGQYASYHGGPLPAAPVGPPVQNEYRPPSRAAGQHKLLWAIFLGLVVVCILVGLQTFQVVDLIGMAGFGRKPIVVPQPTTATQNVESIENLVDNTDNDIEVLLKDVRRDLKNKKLQSALERLNTVETLAPDRPDLFELRAQAYDALGETDKAEAARAHAQELAEKNAAVADPSATSDAGVDSN